MKCGTIAVLGRPNVGKSTLVNALVKQKIAIVSEKPQTTRTRILGVAHLPGAQLAFLDTPGLHQPWYRLNQRMVQRALEAITVADILTVMVDARRLPGPEDRAVLDQIFRSGNVSSPLPCFLLVNKVDLIPKPQVLPVIEAYANLGMWTEIIPLSAKCGLNMDRLVDLLIKQLPEQEPGYNDETVTDQPLRQFAAEVVREKVLAQTKAELPYAVAVKVDEFVEHERLVHIRASIVVDKPGQKAIVIGKRGLRLKTIGMAARLELEQEVGKPVFLELYVKVHKAWRDDPRMLAEFGY
ncbi:MAG: GTPase Era [Nitrospirae bacterium]|nr:MAG: GTPase Era [Nitrospirota bacterium]